MITSLIKNKLSERRGVSIVIALFALIVITVISTLVLNSASSNAGRVRRNQQAEQNYLTEGSAVQLMKDCLSGVNITYDYQDVDRLINTNKTTYTDKLSNGDISPFKADLLAWFDKNAIEGTGEKLDKYYYIKLKDKTDIDGSVKFHDVVIHAYMDENKYPDLVEGEAETTSTGDAENGSTSTTETGSGKAEMVLDFTLKNSDSADEDYQNYKMTMTAGFDCTYTKIVTTETETKTTTTGGTGGKPSSTQKTTTTTTTTSVSCSLNNNQDQEPEIKKGVHQDSNEAGN